MSNDDLSLAIKDMTDAISDQSEVIRELEEKIDKQNERLENFVPKSRFRIYMALIAVVVVLVVGNLVWARALERRNAIAGCERGNDARATIAEVVETAVRPIVIPADVSDDLREAYEQGNARTLALRNSLLNLPGIQQVDCSKVVES